MVTLPDPDEPWQRSLLWSHRRVEANAVIHRLLAHIDPDHTTLPAGLAHAVANHLHRNPSGERDAVRAVRWAAHVSDEGRSPVDPAEGVTMIDETHTALWHLAIAGSSTVPPSDPTAIEVLAAWTLLIATHTDLDGRHAPATLIAGAYRGLQLHRTGQCSYGISTLQDAWLSWHLIHRTGTLIPRLITDDLAANCVDAEPDASITHHRAAVWLAEETAAGPLTTVAIRSEPVPANPPSLRAVPMMPGWAGLPGLPAPPRSPRHGTTRKEATR